MVVARSVGYVRGLPALLSVGQSMNLPLAWGNVVIAGGPCTGKTTLAAHYECDDLQVRHTDDLMATHDWSAASDEVASWFGASGRWVVEGVASARALRKWLAANDTGKPCDTVVLMTEPHGDTTAGQSAMAKGCATVWAEIEPALLARGVRVQHA